MLILVELASSVEESTFDANIYLLHLDCRLFIVNNYSFQQNAYHPKGIADYGDIMVDLKVYQLLIGLEWWTIMVVYQLLQFVDC